MLWKSTLQRVKSPQIYPFRDSASFERTGLKPHSITMLGYTRANSRHGGEAECVSRSCRKPFTVHQPGLSRIEIHPHVSNLALGHPLIPEQFLSPSCFIKGCWKWVRPGASVLASLRTHPKSLPLRTVINPLTRALCSARDRTCEEAKSYPVQNSTSVPKVKSGFPQKCVKSWLHFNTTDGFQKSSLSRSLSQFNSV